MSDHDALSRLYRQLPAEEPSANLDAKVLAAVNAELEAERERRARRQRRWRYHVPLATAATLMLAVALLLSQPGSRQELLERQSDTAYEMSPAYEMRDGLEKRAGIAADNSGPVRKLHELVPPPPPPPASVSAPPPVIESPAMAAMPAPAPASEPAPTIADALENYVPPVMGIVADRALKQAPKVEMLLKEAPGMAAAAFCMRLRALWTATDTTGAAAPDCPTTDGNHEWPIPMAVMWEVKAGQVVRAKDRH